VDEVESMGERGRGSLELTNSKETSFILTPAPSPHPDQRALHDLTRWRCSVRHAGDVRIVAHVEAVAVGMMRQWQRRGSGHSSGGGRYVVAQTGPSDRARRA